MQIILDDIGKRFNRQWIFKGVNLNFNKQQAYAITGNNGSGKSTLLQLIYNFQTISKGSITYLLNQRELANDDLAGCFAFAAPYLDLIEEFTLNEMIAFHFGCLQVQAGINLKEIVEYAGLAGNEQKQVRYFSSGMKQRLKLILALYAATPVLLLDEPCSNLDAQGIAWYRKSVLDQAGKRTIIIASNQRYEYDFCDEVIDLLPFKPGRAQ